MKTETRNLAISIATLTASRLVINMTRRFAYPFLPAIARQLDVPLASVQSVTAVQGGMGVISPLFGPLSERYGRKRVLLAAMLMMAGVGIIGAILPQFWLFAAVMLAFGLGKMIFDPVALAYLGDRIPYHRRGMAIGINELSWAGSLIIAAPVAGFLLETSGLQAVFLALSAILLLGAGLIAFAIPPDHPTRGTPISIVTPLDAWRTIRHSPTALGALGYCLFLSIANETFFINYGAWMETAFQLDLASLGAASTVIAAAEILGEFTVIGMADRFGKRRLTIIAASVASLTYIMMPGLAFSLPLTLAGLFTMFLAVETAIVASIPLFTEVMPNARSVMMSGVVGAHSGGRMMGALMGSLLYGSAVPFILISGFSTCLGLLSMLLLWRHVHE